jgi:hypothetical protein
MPIRRFAKVILLAPAIGSAAIGLVGLLIGGVLLLRPGSSHHRTLTPMNHAAASLPERNTADSVPAQKRTVIAMHARAVAPAVLPAATLPPHAAARLIRAQVYTPRERIFTQPVSRDQLSFLKDDAGQPAADLIRQQGLRTLVDDVVPYVPFHFGLDMPLPHAVEGMLSASRSPMEIRDGRYATMTGIPRTGGKSRAFLWIDMRQGIGLGAIFFYPSNGEPTPTLTVFSRQITRTSIHIAQLPAQFVQDLSQWAASEEVPPLTTRYFINASSGKTVLAHDEDFCRRPEGSSKISKDNCDQMNSDARQLDLKASHFLSETHFASNATMHMLTASVVQQHIIP